GVVTFCPRQSVARGAILGLELARQVAKSAFAVLMLKVLPDVQIVSCVAIPDSVRNWIACELLLGELAPRFKHPVSPLTCDGVRVDNQRLLNESRQRLDNMVRRE